MKGVITRLGARGDPRRRGLWAAALSIALLALVLALPPGTAFAAQTTYLGSAISGAYGIRIDVPTTSDEDNESSGDVGIRLEVPTASDEAHSTGAGVGIRLEVPTSADEDNESSGDVGIRLEVPTASDEAHSTGADVGIRLEVPTSADEDNESSGSIGIRLAIDGVVYMVEFDADGGRWTEDGSTLKCVAVEQGKAIDEMPDNPRRSGYGFGGWLDESGAPWTADRIVSRDMHLKALWYEKPVNIAFDANGGTYGLDDGGLDITSKLVENYVGGKFVNTPDPLPTRRGCTFAGWWSDDGLAEDGTPDGNWGVGIDEMDVPDVPEDAGENDVAATVYARWIEAVIDIQVDDPSGAFDDAGWTGRLVFNKPLANGKSDDAGEPSMDAVPKVPGYLLSGLYWGAADDEVNYYLVRYLDDGAGRWVRGQAFTDRKGQPLAWTMIEHAKDLRTVSPDGSVADGPDGVPDTIVLEARWDLRFEATIPVSLSFGLSGDGESAPSVTAPDDDAFKIRSYTTAELKVAEVKAEGIDVPATEDAEAGGLGALLFAADAGGGTEHLAYTDALGSAEDETIRLTLDPASEESAREVLPIADATGALAGPTATTVVPRDGAKFSLPASPNGIAESALPIKWGLAFPERIRAAGRDEPGQIARVTFTLSMTTRALG